MKHKKYTYYVDFKTEEGKTIANSKRPIVKFKCGDTLTELPLVRVKGKMAKKSRCKKTQNKMYLEFDSKVKCNQCTIIDVSKNRHKTELREVNMQFKATRFLKKCREAFMMAKLFLKLLEHGLNTM